MLKNTKKLTSQGFTIVELLIVIVVIGILVSIVIVVYKGVQNRATIASIQSENRVIQQKIEAFKITSGSYPTDPVAELGSRGLKVNQSNYAVQPSTNINFTYCYDPTLAKFVVVILSKDGKKYAYGTDLPFKEIIPANTTGTGINTSNANDGSCSYFSANSYVTYAGYDPYDVYHYDGDTLPWRKWLTSQATF